MSLQQRCLVIAVEAVMDKSEYLAPKAVEALRKYANMLEAAESGQSALERIKISPTVGLLVLHVSSWGPIDD